MKKLKIKKSIKKYLIIAGCFILLLLISIFTISKIKYHNSLEYKLLKTGYNEKEIMVFKEKIDDDNIQKLIDNKYNSFIAKLVNEKYYLSKNYEAYLAYHALKPETTSSEIVSIVNVHADNDWYHKDIVKDADLSKNNSVLVNKFNKLSDTYAPDDLVKASLQYSYNDNTLRKEAYDNFKAMCDDAKKQNLTLILASGYRTYQYQSELYNYYIGIYGEEKTDIISARAGYSEHQTGLTLDILKYGVEMRKFVETEEFSWLQDNAYKYGFILRYPEGKEHITGYDYEPWHYRYVGNEISEKIKNENITFDEYYAFYLEN